MHKLTKTLIDLILYLLIFVVAFNIIIIVAISKQSNDAIVLALFYGVYILIGIWFLVKTIKNIDYQLELTNILSPV